MSWLFKGVDHAKLYQKFRPVYPSGVYTTIYSYLESSGIKRGTSGRFTVALDIGCGTGLSTLPLCDHFETVIGVDYSDAQLGEARIASQSHNNVTYRVALGHELTFQPDGSVDLITVATAIHWFNTELFFKECHRVLRPGGVLAAYSIGMLVASPPAVGKIVEKVSP